MLHAPIPPALPLHPTKIRSNVQLLVMATAADPLGSDTGPLGSDSLGFDPDRDYSKGDRLKIVGAEYARQLKAYETGGPGIKKPNVPKLARDWNVAPQSIRNHFISLHENSAMQLTKNKGSYCLVTSGPFWRAAYSWMTLVSLRIAK
jgi:hypothetical protein